MNLPITTGMSTSIGTCLVDAIINVITVVQNHMTIK
jgi:hypothetical protein